MPQTSKQKRDGRRKRVFNLLKKYNTYDEFTAQDVANKCNLSGPISAGQIITGFAEELNIERISDGKYKVIG
jgi:hypothetical protein